VRLHFASFAMTCLRRDSHPQECAHGGRTKPKARLPYQEAGFHGSVKTYQRNPNVTGNILTVPVPTLFGEVAGESTQT
jgi:hypothetical protein